LHAGMVEVWHCIAYIVLMCHWETARSLTCTSHQRLYLLHVHCDALVLHWLSCWH